MYDNRVRVLEIDHVNLINRQMEIDKLLDGDLSGRGKLMDIVEI